ncbi:MAG: hypothetical protein H6622_02730 [Halobacteriovoraceae bacterium]|nr:hypothetical protein [Halobacteriovoraceae bacterium]
MQEVTIDNSTNFANSIFIEAIEVLDKSIHKFLNDIELFNQFVNENKIQNAQSTFHNMILELENFLPLLVLLKSNLKEYKSLTALIKEFNAFEINVLENLKKILVARENNDLILLCDLLQYEMKDSFDSWQKETLQKLYHHTLDINEK